ncbi:hypothetical protein Tco_1314153 [Tanacetum coccineum]
MASMNTRLNIEKLDGNIVQKHGGSKQVMLGSNNLVPVSNDDTAVAQRRLEDKQPKKKTNTDCLVKEQEKVHLSIKVWANITVTRVPGQEGAEGNVAEKKKLKESMKANLGKLLMYNAWSTRWSPVRVTSYDILVISKWKAGLKDDMDVRSDVYVLINGCRKCSDDNDGYYWEYTPDKANGNVLGMEIIKDQSGNTLRVSQSHVLQREVVQTLLEGHLYCHWRSGSWIICRDYRQTKVVVVFDYAMGRSITVMGLEKEDGKGTLTESRHEAKGIAGMLLCLGKRRFLIRGSSTSRGCYVSVLTNSDTKVEIVRYSIHFSQ